MRRAPVYKNGLFFLGCWFYVFLLYEKCHTSPYLISKILFHDNRVSINQTFTSNYRYVLVCKKKKETISLLNSFFYKVPNSIMYIFTWKSCFSEQNMYISYENVNLSNVYSLCTVNFDYPNWVQWCPNFYLVLWPITVLSPIIHTQYISHLLTIISR